MMKKVKSIKWNLGAIVLSSIVCFFLFRQSGALDNAGMSALILNWLPLIIGVFTIVFFLVANFFTKKIAWLVTVLGIILNIGIAIKSFFG